jgi:hypothetical protein
VVQARPDALCRYGRLSAAIPGPDGIAMGLLDFFRRGGATPIQDAGGLADFIDRNAAFLVQKGIYEYARARAGHYSKVLFAESSFQEAVELSRWRAYPLGLAMIAEMVDGILRPHTENRRAALDALMALTLSVFDRYPVPAALGAAAWAELRSDLLRRLDQIGTHAVKPAKDIPVPFAESYFNLMPIHEKLRMAEFPTITSYLRVTLCNIHDEFSGRADAAALGRALSSSPG